MFVPDHQHLLIKGKMLNPPKTVEQLNDWLSRLVKKVRMEVLHGPFSVRVDDVPGNEGITGVVVLATSHSSIHVWDTLDIAEFHFDLYSCTQFSSEEVREHLDEYGLSECEWIFIDRNEFKVKESGSKVVYNQQA
jgi:S-adenosylmethionine/arginine decarboxylase-like enzyme